MKKIQQLGGESWIRDKIHLEDEYLELKRLSLLDVKMLDDLNEELCKENDELMAIIKNGKK